MAEQAMKVTAEMLGPGAPEAVAAPEDREYMSYDIARLAAFADVDVDFKKARSPDYITQLALEHTQLLMNKIFALPSEPAEVGRLVRLPAPVLPLPREKPLPQAKVETRWEKFAERKGITKKKRSALVFDEATQTYKRRYGYKKANDESDAWLVENKMTDTYEKGEDPFSMMKKEKRARVAKNKERQMTNIREATGGKRTPIPGGLDLSSVLGNARPMKRNQQHKERKLQTHAEVALRIAQRSTNSMGKFDVKRKGEPMLQGPRTKRRDEVLSRPDVEKAQQAAVMRKIFGRKEKEGEAMSMKRAMASIGAGDVGKGEIVTARAVQKKRELKKKIVGAKAAKDKRKAEAAKLKKGKASSKTAGGGRGKSGTKGRH